MNRTAPIAGIGVLAVAGLALAGCSGSTSPAAGGGVTITYSDFISAGGNEKNLQAIVDAFEKENAGITVEVKTLPYADYFTALQTDLAGGTAADVFDIEFANYAAYQKSGVLASTLSANAGPGPLCSGAGAFPLTPSSRPPRARGRLPTFRTRGRDRPSR